MSYRPGQPADILWRVDIYLKLPCWPSGQSIRGSGVQLNYGGAS